MNKGFPLSPIRPMEPMKCKEVFDSKDHVFQVKWDGVRILTFYNGNDVILQNRRLNNRTMQYPELQNLRQMVQHPVILDGEVIALKDGKPSFPTVMRRDRAGSSTARSLVKTIPIAYMVFDILYYRDQSMMTFPWHLRQKRLSDLLSNAHEPFYLVEDFPQGIRLFEEVQRMGLEGVVAKVKDSPYIPGGKSRFWQKIKNRTVITCVIGGFTLRGKIVNSLVLGVYEEENFLYVGRVGTGLGEDQWVRLTRILSEDQVDTPAFMNPPQRREITWVKPLHQVTVEFAEWTAETRLRSPVVKEILV